MECKYSKQSVSFINHNELIDTLWNVNSFPKTSSVVPECELIDTLWNVNIMVYTKSGILPTN